VKVTDPSGQTWRVSRRWVPWRPRFRDVESSNLLDFGNGGGGSGGDGGSSGGGGGGFDIDLGEALVIIAVVIAAIVFLIFVAPVLLAIVFALAEWLIVLVVLPIAVAGRVIFGRKWHVEVRRGWRAWCEVEAGDWTASTVKIHELADAVRRGEVPERSIDIT
jgi:hypothetical protein